MAQEPAAAGPYEPAWRPEDRFRPEAAVVGEQFGLGACEQIWVARRRHPVFGCGSVLLLTGLGLLASQLFYSGTTRAVFTIISGGTAILGGALMARFPTVTWDRVFRYRDALVQVVASAPEPALVRWAGVAQVSMSFSHEDGDHDLEKCSVSTAAGAAVTLDRGYGVRSLGEFATRAERFLVATVLPGLIETYESGQPVTLGKVRIDQQGIAHTTSAPWSLPWTLVQRVRADGPGQEVVVWPKDAPGRDRKKIDLEDCPNGVLVHHLAERAGAAVEHVSRYWRPEEELAGQPAPQDAVAPSGAGAGDD